MNMLLSNVTSQYRPSSLNISVKNSWKAIRRENPSKLAAYDKQKHSESADFCQGQTLTIASIPGFNRIARTRLLQADPVFWCPTNNFRALNLSKFSITTKNLIFVLHFQVLI